MKIDVFLTPGEFPDYLHKGRRVVLVDVLRACTSLTEALNAGAELIVPTDSIEGAKHLLSLLDRKSTLLAGEKDGQRVPGFDLGNSPREFRDPAVAGKTIVFTSDSGAPLMTRMYDEVEKPLVSLVNVSAVADYLLAPGDEEFSVLCAGHDRRFSLEDAVCAGMLCHSLQKRAARSAGPWELNDAAHATIQLYEKHRGNLADAVSSASKGAFLRGIGLADDIGDACRVDSITLVAVVREGRVVAARASE
jgi:2-phosphosulfolactate phosphatase